MTGWKIINSYSVQTPDNNVETYHFETNDAGDFRITNDFGNINIEMARMSGYEFIKRLNRSYRDEILSGEPEDDNLNYGNYNGTSTGLPNVIKGNTPTGKLVYPTMSKPATGYTTNTIGKAFKSLKTKDALKAYKKSNKSKKS